MFNTSGDSEYPEDTGKLALQAIQRDRRRGSREVRHYEVDIYSPSARKRFTWVPRMDIAPPEP
jgi:hypothetical protein